MNSCQKEITVLFLKNANTFSLMNGLILFFCLPAQSPLRCVCAGGDPTKNKKLISGMFYFTFNLNINIQVF